MDGYWNAADYQNQAMETLAAIQQQADQRRAIALQERAAQAQADAQRQELARQEQLRNDWSAAATTGTPDAWDGLFRKYPDQYKALRESMDTMGRDRRMAEVNYAMQMYAAPDIKAAEALAKRKAAALRTAGNEQEARAIEENMSAFPDTASLRAAAGSIIWGGAPPETAKAFFEANKQASPKDMYDVEEAKYKAQKAGFEAQRQQQELNQAASPYAQDMADRKQIADINKTEAEIRKLNAEAGAKAEESNKARAESLKTPSDVREHVNRLNALNSSLRGPRWTAKALLDVYNSPEGKRLASGASAELTEIAKKIFGEQNPATRTQELFEMIKRTQANAAEANLRSPGSTSDFEQRLMNLALPDTYAAVENKRDFVERVYEAFEAAKVEAVSAAKFNQYAGTGDKGFAGVSQNDNPDVGLKKGMTLPEYVESQIAAAGITPIAVYKKKATGERTNVMPNPRPQGGLSSEPAKAGGKSAYERALEAWRQSGIGAK